MLERKVHPGHMCEYRDDDDTCCGSAQDIRQLTLIGHKMGTFCKTHSRELREVYDRNIGDIQ